MQQNRDAAPPPARRREDDDEPMDAADVRVVDAVITSEESVQSNPMYAETETQRPERRRAKKGAQGRRPALARKVRRKGEKGTASSSDDADAGEAPAAASSACWSARLRRRPKSREGGSWPRTSSAL